MKVKELEFYLKEHGLTTIGRRQAFPREVVKKVGGEQKRGMKELSLPNSFGKVS